MPCVMDGNAAVPIWLRSDSCTFQQSTWSQILLYRRLHQASFLYSAVTFAVFTFYKIILLGDRHMCQNHSSRLVALQWRGRDLNPQPCGCNVDALTTTPPSDENTTTSPSYLFTDNEQPSKWVWFVIRMTVLSIGVYACQCLVVCGCVVTVLNTISVLIHS